MTIKFRNRNLIWIYDIQWGTRDLLNATDGNIRSTFQALNDGDFRHYSQFSERMKVFDSVSIEILATERAWQTGLSDSEYMREMGVLHDRALNYIDSHILK